MTVLHDYPYLCWSIALCLIFFLIFTLAMRFRKLMVMGGLASALYSLSAVYFVPDYWQPFLVIKTSIGLEDMLFSFANGGIVSFISFWALRDRLQFSYSPGRLLGKYFFCTIFGAIFCYVLLKAGIPVMICCLCAMVVLGLALLAKNKRHWPLSVMGALGFTSLYVVVTGLLGIVFPLFHSQWTIENLLGVRFLGFPVEEYLWALGFGAVFPLILAFAMGITLKEIKSDRSGAGAAMPNF